MDISSSEDLEACLPALVSKFSKSAPRYTSYPTAAEFNADFDSQSWRRQISSIEPDSAQAFSLYFHLPFCHSLCYFCACNKVISKSSDVVAPYLSALLKELKMYQQLLGKEISLEQIHWGGGTPNFFSPEEMKTLHNSCQELFPHIRADADISVEVDPRTLSRKHIETLSELGFNRISLGVQDFNPLVQQSINRIQSYEQTRDVCVGARNLGIESLNIDLIYGLPNQTVQGLQDTIDRVIELRPNRLALYGYAHVTWLEKVQKAMERAHIPTPAERVGLFLAARSMLLNAGYEFIGLDHFALPDDELAVAAKTRKLNRNFMGYTTHFGANVIGVGASAISSLATAFSQNVRNVTEYQQVIESGSFPVERGYSLTREDKLRGALIEELLCHGAVNISKFKSRWEIDFTKHFAEEFQQLGPLEKEGLLTLSEEEIVLTDLGRIFSRNVAAIFDTYLAKYERGSKPAFSQAV